MCPVMELFLWSKTFLTQSDGEDIAHNALADLFSVWLSFVLSSAKKNLTASMALMARRLVFLG